MSESGGFVIVDVETSGFSPKKNRIVEIGLVIADNRGEPVESWTTRFNPQGPVGPTHVHGIRAEDVKDAPIFADMVPIIVERLRGRVLVAHNARFDLSFLRAEFERAGWEFPIVPTFCTLDESWYYLPDLEQHKLSDCCIEIGVTQDVEHSALHDAEATALLFSYFLNPNNPPPPRDEHLRLPLDALCVEWPTAPTATPATWVAPEKTPTVSRDHWKKPVLSAPLVKTLDEYALGEAIEAGAPLESKAYLELLISVLGDGVLTADEGFSLAELAQMYELSRDTVKLAHRGFLIALAHQALRDETVTREEREEMKLIAHLLDLPGDVVAEALSDARATRHSRQAESVAHGELPVDWSLGEPLRVGDRVVFTGCEPTLRAQLEVRAKESGVRVTSSVSRKTSMLITDGGFSGNKAAQAAAAGTRLVHPDDFAVLLDHIQPASSSS